MAKTKREWHKSEEQKQNDFKGFEVMEELGDISVKGNFTLKLRYGKWGDNPAKYDLRAWNDEGKCRNGLTLTGEEMETLYEIMKKYIEG